MCSLSSSDTESGARSTPHHEERVRVAWDSIRCLFERSSLWLDYGQDARTGSPCYDYSDKLLAQTPAFIGLHPCERMECRLHPFDLEESSEAPPQTKVAIIAPRDEPCIRAPSTADGHCHLFELKLERHVTRSDDGYFVRAKTDSTTTNPKL